MSDTVSYTNVHLQYTADVAGLRQAKADMAAMQRVTNAAKTETQKYEEHMLKLDRLLHNGKITQDQYNQAVMNAAIQHRQLEAMLKNGKITQEQYNQAIANGYVAEKNSAAAKKVAATAQNNLNTSIAQGKKQLSQAEQAAKSYANALRGIAGAMGSAQLGMLGGGVGLLATGGPLAIAGLATAGVGYAAVESSKAYMDLRSELVRLEVLLGSAKEAQDKFQQMRALAAVSPLETKDFTQAAAVLAQYGVESEHLMDVLRRLSDVSAGNSDVFGRLALAYGQVKAAARLTGQEVRQLINAGFNPLAEISRTTGESMESLKKRMEDGDIAFSSFAKSVETATDAGGRFFGMTDRMAGEMSAKVAQLRDEWTKLKEAIGEAIAPEATQALTTANKMIQDVRNTMTILSPSEVFRAFNRGGADREFMFRAQGRVQGLKPGFMDPLTQREMEAAKREHETMVKQLEQRLATESISVFKVASKAIAEGVAGQFSGAVKSTQQIHSSLSDAAKVMREHSQDITQFNVKRRAQAKDDIEALQKQLKELVPAQQEIRTDLPAAVEYGTREAYRVIADAQKMADDAHLKKLEEQRLLQVKQNELLQQIRDKQAVMGIVK